MTDKTPAMPELPEPAHRGPTGTGAYFDSYTADQMRAYATQYAMWTERLRAQPAGQIDPDAERKKARADLNLYGVGFLVDGRHVPAMRVSAIWGDNKPAGQAGGEPVGAITAASIDSYPAEDRAFFAFWYSHMLNDLMQPPLTNISHAEARYIFDAGAKAAALQDKQLLDLIQAGLAMPAGFSNMAEMQVWRDAVSALSKLRHRLTTAPQQQAGGEVVAALVLEKIDTLVATINGAHTAKSDGWREGCWAAADLVLGEIKRLLATPAPAPEPEPKAEPVPSDQAKWCEYVAGMVYGWLETLKELPPEERCTKAIAGIIGRRLWALKQAEPVRVPEGFAQVPVEPTPEMLKAMESQWLVGSQVDTAKREYAAMLAAAQAKGAGR